MFLGHLHLYLKDLTFSQKRYYEDKELIQSNNKTLNTLQYRKLTNKESVAQLLVCLNQSCLI